MLNKPKFMSPSINMYGNSVIDLNSDTLPFSCIVDGNEAVTDFQIVISRLKDNVVVFDTGMKKLDKPFFPINNRNQNVVFKINLKNYLNSDAQNSDAQNSVALIYYKPATKNYDETKKYYKKQDGVYVKSEITAEDFKTNYEDYYYIDFINSADAYYWAITFKNENSGTVTHSTEEVFYANSVPSTEISYSYKDDFSDLSQDFKGLQKRKVYFKSTYSQAEGVLLKRYGWRLTDTINNYVIMDTISKNQIYGVADDISCVCNGLMNNTEYRLETYIETQNGYFDILQSIVFYVNYPVEHLEADFEVTPLDYTSGIMLNWGNLKTTEGVIVGDLVNYIETVPTQNSTSVKISKDTSIVFSSISSSRDLEIDENSYVVISFQFDKSCDIKLFEMSGEDRYSNNMIRKLEYIQKTNKLKYTVIKGDILATCEKELNDKPNDLCWYIVTLNPMIDYQADFQLGLSVAQNVPYPKEDKYPDEGFYPSLGEWGKSNVL